MNAKITDPATLSALRPLEVVSYLRSNGWKKAGERAGQWSTWHKRDQAGDEFEIAVPLDPQFRDFAARMADVLQVLEVFEARSQFQILSDLLVTGADVIRLRLADTELADASVPLDEGAVFVQKAKDLVLAAACAAVKPRMYYPSRKPAQAMEYIRRARLGQTEQGSFILTIISPVPPSLMDRNGQHIGLDEPYERHVTRTLASALQAVKQAAEDAATTGEVDSFVQGVSRGVSANLCDALVGMGSFAEGNRTLGVQFSWSRSRPVAAGADLPGSIVFTTDVFPVLRAAAVYLKESSPREEFEFRGFVVKLERPEGSPVGRVTIRGVIDDLPRRVIVELSEADYHRAVAAHDQGRLVHCSGVLIREGRSFRLHESYAFAVEDDEES